MERAAAVLGLFHDLGKYDPAFQRRLEGTDIRVDHSTAGAKVLVDLATEAARQGHARAEDVFMAELLAYAGVDRNLHNRKRSDDGAQVARRVRAWIETTMKRSIS